VVGTTTLMKITCDVADVQFASSKMHQTRSPCSALSGKRSTLMGEVKLT